MYYISAETIIIVHGKINDLSCFVLSNCPGLLEFSFLRNQSASVPLGGSYALSYGASTASIPHDAEEGEVSCDVMVFTVQLSQVKKMDTHTDTSAESTSSYLPNNTSIIM